MGEKFESGKERVEEEREPSELRWGLAAFCSEVKPTFVKPIHRWKLHPSSSSTTTTLQQWIRMFMTASKLLIACRLAVVNNNITIIKNIIPKMIIQRKSTSKLS